VAQGMFSGFGGRHGFNSALSDCNKLSTHTNFAAHAGNRWASHWASVTCPSPSPPPSPPPPSPPPPTPPPPSPPPPSPPSHPPSPPRLPDPYRSGFHCFSGEGGTCYHASSSCFGSCAGLPTSEAPWAAPAYTNDIAGFGAYCASWSANAGVFNGDVGFCPAGGTFGYGAHLVSDLCGCTGSGNQISCNAGEIRSCGLSEACPRDSSETVPHGDDPHGDWSLLCVQKPPSLPPPPAPSMPPTAPLEFDTFVNSFTYSSSTSKVTKYGSGTGYNGVAYTSSAATRYVSRVLQAPSHTPPARAPVSSHSNTRYSPNAYAFSMACSRCLGSISGICQGISGNYNRHCRFGLHASGTSVRNPPPQARPCTSSALRPPCLLCTADAPPHCSQPPNSHFCRHLTNRPLDIAGYGYLQFAHRVPDPVLRWQCRLNNLRLGRQQRIPPRGILDPGRWKHDRQGGSRRLRHQDVRGRHLDQNVPWGSQQHDARARCPLRKRCGVHRGFTLRHQLVYHSRVVGAILQ